MHFRRVGDILKLASRVKNDKNDGNDHFETAKRSEEATTSSHTGREPQQPRWWEDGEVARHSARENRALRKLLARFTFSMAEK